MSLINYVEGEKRGKRRKKKKGKLKKGKKENLAFFQGLQGLGKEKKVYFLTIQSTFHK